MAHAIKIYETGGPDKLTWESTDVPAPGVGELRVRNEAVGLNFVDTYYRSGLYPTPLPFIPGSEGAGVVEAAGPKVKGFKVGDRVGYVDPMGAYAEVLLRPADRVVKLPAHVSSADAAAVMLKGLTAHYLLKRTYQVKKGQTILVHAAAGGVGQILCAWAKHLGVAVIGTVGTEEKAKIAKKVGCRHVIVTTSEKVSTRVREITNGQGVPVVYDGVGRDTFADSLDCLSPLGLMVSFGNASGAVAPFEIATLSKKGSLFLTRPSLKNYVEKNEDLVASARDLFNVIKKGAVKISINQRYPLREAAQAHADLAARKTTGSTIFIP